MKLFAPIWSPALSRLILAELEPLSQCPKESLESGGADVPFPVQTWLLLLLGAPPWRSAGENPLPFWGIHEHELEKEAPHGLSFKDLLGPPPAQHFLPEELFSDDNAVPIIASPDQLETLAAQDLPELLEERVSQRFVASRDLQ